ncbi:MAG: TIGR02186 family protein [Alphaproteobacteria bacterium]|nr:TIGR02186 family protein [Alphaproteobacteria bacterium]
MSFKNALKAEPLVADISTHLIAITTGFSGDKLLLFGAVDGEGDIVIIIRGPTSDTIVRKKEQILGIWVNRHSVAYQNIPSFYSIASTKPVIEFMNESLRRQYQIGLDQINLNVTEGEQDIEFQKALLRNKEKKNLYLAEPAKVIFLGNQLFRAEVFFPSNVPTGNYLVDVMLVRNNEIVGAFSTPLFVSKVGFSAAVYDWAHQQSALYGIASIIIAVCAGSISYFIFRRK